MFVRILIIISTLGAAISSNLIDKVKNPKKPEPYIHNMDQENAINKLKSFMDLNQIESSKNFPDVDKDKVLNKRVGRIHPTPNQSTIQNDGNFKASSTISTRSESSQKKVKNSRQKKRDLKKTVLNRSIGSTYGPVNDLETAIRSSGNRSRTHNREIISPSPNVIQQDVFINSRPQVEFSNSNLSDRSLYLSDGYFPQIAINEENELYAAITGYDEQFSDSLSIIVLKSEDGGSSWESFVTVYSQSGNLYDPDIETLDDRILVAYEYEGQMQALYVMYDNSNYAFSTIAETDFGLASIVSDKFYYPLETTWTYLTYYSENYGNGTADMYVSLSTDQGLTWSEPIQISDNDAYWVSAGNSIAYSMTDYSINEFCLVGWMDNTGSAILSRIDIYDIGYYNSFTSTSVLTSDTDYYFSGPSVAAYYQDIFVSTEVFWENDSSDIALTFSSDNGENWGADYSWYYWQDEFSVPDIAPACAFGSDGTLGFSWSKANNIFYRVNTSQDWLNNWSLETLVEGDLGDNYSNACVIGNDLFHAVYDEGGYETVYYKELSLDPAPPLSNNFAEGYYPQVSLAENGDIYVAFTEVDNSISDYLFVSIYKSEDDGDSWERHSYVWNSGSSLTFPDIEVLEDRYVITFESGGAMLAGYVMLSDPSSFSFSYISEAADYAYGSIISDKFYYGLDETYSYVSFIAGASVYYSTSTDQGATWSSAVQLNTGSDALDIAVGNSVAYSVSDETDAYGYYLESCQVGWRSTDGNLHLTDVDVYDDSNFEDQIVMEPSYDNNAGAWEYWFYPPSVGAYFNRIIYATTVVWEAEGGGKDIALTFSSDNGDSWGDDYGWYYWDEDFEFPDENPVSTFGADGEVGFVWIKGNYVYYRSNISGDWLNGWSDESLVDNGLMDIYQTGCIISGNQFHAVYDEGENGKIFHGSWDLVIGNSAPEVFDLLSPSNNATLDIDESNVESGVLDITWEASNDPDGDDVSYQFVLYAENWEEDYSVLQINTDDTFLSLPYAAIADLLDDLEITTFSGDWTVYASDGEDETMASEVRSVNINYAGDGNSEPEEFNLLSPENNAVLNIDESNIESGVLDVTWEASNDPDGDDVTYTFLLYSGTFSGGNVLLEVSTSEISLSLSYSSIVDLLNGQDVTTLNADWTVYASDGEDETRASEIRMVTINYESGLSTDNSFLPINFELNQNCPNPFNPLTEIKYGIPENSHVKITVYDLLGNIISNLINENQSAGFKTIVWDATNNQGQSVSAGVYLYSIESGEFRQTKKMILLK